MLRVRSELVPGYALETGEHEMVLTESDGGNFYIFGEANGVRVRFLIDTGASDTVLTPSDAANLGIDVRALDFSRVYGTANGLGRGAPYTLEKSLGRSDLDCAHAGVRQRGRDGLVAARHDVPPPPQIVRDPRAKTYPAVLGRIASSETTTRHSLVQRKLKLPKPPKPPNIGKSQPPE